MKSIIKMKTAVNIFVYFIFNNYNGNSYRSNVYRLKQLLTSLGVMVNNLILLKVEFTNSSDLDYYLN